MFSRPLNTLGVRSLPGKAVSTPMSAFSWAIAASTRELYFPSMPPPSYPLQYIADWTMRQKSADGTVDAFSLGYFEASAFSVVGPKLLESELMPSSYCRARVRAYIVFQLV